MTIRIGQGFDAHRFGSTSPLVLGGVPIVHPCGLIAHSDGDVVLHAVTDALLGAAALGDIGYLFPDTDEAYQGIDSRILLRDTVQRIVQKGYCVGNVDVTIMAQSPMLAPYILQMRKIITADLQCTIAQVNVKATTTEGMGCIGREEGIACTAAVLLLQRER